MSSFFGHRIALSGNCSWGVRLRLLSRDVEAWGMKWTLLSRDVEALSVKWTLLSRDVEAWGVKWTLLSRDVEAWGVKWTLLSRDVEALSVKWTLLSLDVEAWGVKWTLLSRDVEAWGVKWTLLSYPPPPRDVIYGRPLIEMDLLLSKGCNSASADVAMANFDFTSVLIFRLLWYGLLGIWRNIYLFKSFSSKFYVSLSTNDSYTCNK